MKDILKQVFGVDEDGNLAAIELASDSAWMKMLTDRSVHKRDDAFDEELDELWEDYALDEDELEEEEPFSVLPAGMESLQPVGETADAGESGLEAVKEAIKRAGFDNADVEMLYEDEIQEALELAGLEPEEVLQMDRDQLREELLYIIDASLSYEAQLRQSLADAGLVLRELAALDEEEREQALEEAGLEPMDYADFCFTV